MICGVDIGGANLKLAIATLTPKPVDCLAVPFPMWRNWKDLGTVLRSCLTDLCGRLPSQLAVTMTGELADCFQTRRQGVQHIINQVEVAFPKERTFIYTVHGCWMTTEQACENPWTVAASNWHATANWVSRAETWRTPAEHPSQPVRLMVDIGSTTVDIIPFSHNRVLTVAKTDRERMMCDQLIYTGVERTPIAALVSAVELNGKPCPIMAERFADSIDVFLALRLEPEDPNNTDTADGRARTHSGACGRLARMIGEDLESISVEQIESIALQILRKQAHRIAKGIRRNAAEFGAEQVLFCGHGSAIVPYIHDEIRDLNLTMELFSDRFPDGFSRNAPAVAVANLLSMHLSNVP